MKTRHIALLALVALSAGACRKKHPADGPSPANADSLNAVTRERARADSIAMAERDRVERERADRERTDRERAAAEQRTAGARAALTEMVFFDYDSDEVSPDAQAILERKALVMRANPGIRLRIEGNADQRGSTEYNLALGQRRAEAVRAFFGGYGIDVSRFSTLSYGKERPLAEGDDEQAFARNRRAEFSITAGEVTVVPEGIR
jgi:peptidoglycan-associated lipoprotein